MKFSKRKGYTNTASIQEIIINPSSPLPKDIKTTFWPFATNKILHEQVIYKHLCLNISPPIEHPTIFGQVTRKEEDHLQL